MHFRVQKMGKLQGNFETERGMGSASGATTKIRGNVSPDDRREESPKFACAVGVRLPDEQREEPRRGRKGSSEQGWEWGTGNGERIPRTRCTCGEAVRLPEAEGRAPKGAQAAA